MTCPNCRKSFTISAACCPHCGEPNTAISRVFQTVLISVDGTDRFYRSVDEVPARLRTRLLKTTNGVNSATILIADRNGRKEIEARVKSAGALQRRLAQAALSNEERIDPLGWLTPTVRRTAAALIVLLAICVAVAVFLYHGRI